jgi:hypothetical protein
LGKAKVPFGEVEGIVCQNLYAIKFYKCGNFCLWFVVTLDNMGLDNKDLWNVEYYPMAYM